AMVIAWSSCSTTAADTCASCSIQKTCSAEDVDARVMLVRAGLSPAGVEGVRPPGALLPQAA
ncbi:hypothetical protein ACWERA_58630, partial [Streptomyces mirabilis]